MYIFHPPFVTIKQSKDIHNQTYNPIDHTNNYHPGEALMSVVGALIEIPTMLSLVKTAELFRRRLYHGTIDKKVRE